MGVPDNAVVIRLVLCFALVACASAALNVPGCGKAPHPNDRIRGGTVSKKTHWPWQISLRTREQHICGGSLIDNQWVITAAHCVYQNQNPNAYDIQLGHNDRFSDEPEKVTVRVAKVIPHQGYRPVAFLDDIALIKLAQPVSFNNYIQPVCVETVKKNLANRESWATGWGAESMQGKSLRYKMQVKMTIQSDAECRIHQTVHSASQYCAGDDLVEKEGSTCKGDSGGPSVIQDPVTKIWELVGVTSFGRACIDGAVFTRVSYFKDWLMSEMQKN